MLPDFTLRHFHRLISNTTRRRLLVACLLQFFILAFLASATAETIFVDDDGTTGALGNDWSQAKQSISEALESAVPGDQIWVAEGNYLESIDLMTGVQLYGGFAGTETDPGERDLTTHTTTIDGSRSRAGKPSRHVVRMEGLRNTRLDGFTIQGGVADGEGDDAFGGGIFCVGLDETNTIVNCVVQNNSADRGGGMFCQDSDLFLTSCTFTLNSVNGADGEGYTGEGDEAIGNSGQEGGQGGGLFLTGGAPTLRHCTFEANSADGGDGAQHGTSMWNSYAWDGGAGGKGGSGGGAYILRSQATLLSCHFSINTVSGGSGGRSGTFTLPGAAGNGGSGGGLYCDNSTATLSRCDFVGNLVLGGRGGNGGPGSIVDRGILIDIEYNGQKGGKGGSGGGVFVRKSNLLLDLCQFTENLAIGGRGGANWFGDEVWSGGAGGRGGGLYNRDSSVTLNLCEFRKNSVNGGPINTRSPSVHDTSGNYAGAGGLGGGICNYSSQAKLNSCTFLSNTALGGYTYVIWTSPYGGDPEINDGASGGGVYSSRSFTSLSRCLFIANSALGNGGGICDAFGTTTLTNCLFNHNIAKGMFAKQTSSGAKGGGAAFRNSLFAEINNCVFFSNITRKYNQFGSSLYQPGVGGGVFADTLESIRITNTIFHKNVDDAISGVDPDSVSHCLLNNNTNDNIYLAGPFNIGSDPLFIDPENGNFHLQDGSPALDRGDPLTSAPFDFLGNPRPGSDDLVDIGFVESAAVYLPSSDQDLPESWVAPLPRYHSTALLDVPYTSLDATSGVQYVELYYRKKGEDWKQYGTTFTQSPIAFDTSITGGDGYYEFMSIATDRANHSEDIPSLPDAKTFISTSFSGSRIYVDQNASGNETGENWANALTEIEFALGIAKHNGIGEIWVAKGRYFDSIQMQSNLSLYGGFEGIETELNERDIENLNPIDTIIDASRLSRVATIQNVSNVVLDGFCLTSGSAILGGGIYCENLDESVIIRNCLIRENLANGGKPSAGGGIYCQNASPLIRKCVISKNKSIGVEGYYLLSEIITPGDSMGGGLYLRDSSPTLDQCQIEGNIAIGGHGGRWTRSDYGDPNYGHSYRFEDALSQGGGLYAQDSTPVLLDCRVETNFANGGHPVGGQGGGFYLKASQALVMNTIIRRNEARGGTTLVREGSDGSGGGLYASSNSTATLANCVISENRARGGNGASRFYYVGEEEPAGLHLSGSAYGGAIFSIQSHVEVKSCTFYRNETQYGNGPTYENFVFLIGGGLHLTTSTVHISNTVFQENSDIAIYGKITAMLNCLFFDNPDGDYYDFSAEQSIYGAENINSLLAQASGNIDGNPRFVFPKVGDFRLGSGSAAIDAGTAFGAPNIDMAYNPRPVDIPNYGTEGTGSEFDIGAYEATLPLSGFKKFLHDLNGDGRSDLILKEKSTGRVDLALVNEDADNWTISYSSIWGVKYELLGTGDLNGDGRSDLILKYNPSQTVYLCEMNPTATSWNVSYYSQGFYEKYDLLGVGDLNGDGRDDLILKYKPSNTVYICLMNEPGADKIWTVAYYSQGWAEKYSVLGVGDLNDDARDDLILRYNKSGTVYFCHMRESGASWDVAATEAWGDALSLLALADLNGDFRKDLLVSDSEGLTTAWITGESGSTWTKTPVGDWSAYDVLFTGDLNADYRDDLIRQTRATKQVEFLLTHSDDPTSWTASFSADWTNYELLNGLMP